MGEPERRSRRLPRGVLAGLFLLAVAYVPMSGPALWLENRSPWLIAQGLHAFYAPLHWADEQGVFPFDLSLRLRTLWAIWH
jgi:hypothetical protein